MSNSVVAKVFGVGEGYELVEMGEQGDRITGLLIVQESQLVCPDCGARDVTRQGRRWREIQTVPIGLTPVFLSTEVPKCRCKKCRKTFEVSPPLPQPIAGSPTEWWISRKGSRRSCA